MIEIVSQEKIRIDKYLTYFLKNDCFSGTSRL